LLCLLFFYNLVDLPSELCRSYHSGTFWSSCCSCLLESCWSASVITLFFPASYNTLPSSDSLSPSSIHNIKSSLKHYMEKGHLNYWYFVFTSMLCLSFLHVSRLPTWVRGGTGTCLARRYRVWTHESIHLTWLTSSSVSVGLYLNEIPRKYERHFPWITAPMQRYRCLALAVRNNAKVDRSAWLWTVKHRYLQQTNYRLISIITIIFANADFYNLQKKLHKPMHRNFLTLPQRIYTFILALSFKRFDYLKWPERQKPEIAKCFAAPKFTCRFSEKEVNYCHLKSLTF
jgi:hypothetical protein